ncbi:MAG: contractile injection system tape measure protein [Bacteroidales bacterium]
MTHFIKKQRLQIKFKGSETEGFALQKQLMDVYYSKVLPELDKAFDACAHENTHLVFDRLSINLGNFEIDKIGEQFAPALVKSVLEKIREKSENIDENNIVTENKINDKPTSLSNEEYLLKVFVYFLQNGNLPWWYKIPVGKSIEEIIGQLLKQEIKSTGIQLVKNKLIETLTEENSRKRLNLQFSVDFCNLFIAWLSPEMAKTTQEVFQLIYGNGFSIDESKIMLEALQQTSLIAISKCTTISGTELKTQSINYLYQNSQKQSELSPWIQKAARLLNVELKPEINSFLSASKTDKLSLNQSQSEDSEQEIKQNEGQISETNTNEFVNQSSSDFVKPNEGDKLQSEIKEIEFSQNGKIGAGLYIENSGLVILHPFLPQLFSALGISENDNLIDTNKALCLLNYLATGQKEMPEYNLILPKVLCQVAITAPAPIEVPLTDNELQEADNLINAVINHWEALRNTSREGLRSTFLLRAGKLSKKEDGDWLLQVENKSFDVLLDQLPWGISVIKLPWMKQMLWVEWRL